MLELYRLIDNHNSHPVEKYDFSLNMFKGFEPLLSDGFSAEGDYFRTAEITEETQLAQQLKQQHPKGNAWYVSVFCGWFENSQHFTGNFLGLENTHL